MSVDEPHMQIETKFLHLRQPVSLGEYLNGWRVCWLGGWDRGRVFFVVMVERKFLSLSCDEGTSISVKSKSRR